MSLKGELEQIKKSFQENPSIDQDIKEAMATFAAHLKRKGLEETAVGQGDPCPDFTLPSAAGGAVSMYETLDKGPAALIFFRGKW